MNVKRAIFVLFLLLICSSLVFSSDWRFVFGDLTQNSEILWGFCPSFFMGGVGYDGLKLIENDLTSFQALVGVGYNNRKVWQNPVTGEVMTGNDPLIFNYLDVSWSFRFLQGFSNNPLNSKKDLVTLSLGYEGKYEKATNSLKVGKNGIVSIDDYFKTYTGSSTYNGSIYPELDGSRDFLGTQFFLNVKLDAMVDNIHHHEGFLANLKIMWGPDALNKALSGSASYFSTYLNLVGAYTLYEIASENQRWFSIVLANRANINYTSGSKVPLFIQGSASLGRKVRGFNSNTYNTEWTFVNNTDLRFSGPDMGLKGLCPRINLFIDFGYGWGNIQNTKIKSQLNFLSSTGAQFTVTAFDFIDLGYQVAYLIKGNNLYDNLKHPGSRVSTHGSVTFFLDF